MTPSSQGRGKDSQRKGKKRPRPPGPSPLPSPLKAVLRRQAASSHRTLCTLLSDEPEGGEIHTMRRFQQGLRTLLQGWRDVGGQGRVLLLGIEGLQEGVRSVPWPTAGEDDLKGLANVIGAAGGGSSRLFGFVAVNDPKRLSPSTLASLVGSLQGGGALVLVFPEAKTWQALLAPSAHKLSGRDLLVEHLVVSLPQCRSWVHLDADLSILPPSTASSNDDHHHQQHQRHRHEEGAEEEEDMSLEDLKESLAETEPVGPLVSQAVTLDQARVLLTFMESASDKSVSATVAVSGPSMRGKSAAIGLCLAGAVAYGYSNIFITSPSPSDAQSIFRYILKGFDALGYQEVKDYDLIQGDMSGVVIRINVFREHRQTVQYMYPNDTAKLEQAEVLVIDDAGALGPEVFSGLLGPYLTVVTMTSALGGAGAAGPTTLSSIREVLRQQTTNTAKQVGAAAAAEVKGSQKAKGERKVHEERWKRAAEAVSALGTIRTLSDLKMEEPVAWAKNDALERWTVRTLGLSADDTHRLRHGTPAPWDCDLYYVDRAALLSGHKMTEQLLHHLLHVYGASDLTKDPDRLAQLSWKSDHVFVLLGPQAEEQGSDGGLPDLLAVVHVRTGRPLPLMMGGGGEGEATVEVCHVATHPEVRRMGYGLRAVQLTLRYFRGELTGEEEEEEGKELVNRKQEQTVTPVSEVPKARTDLPPLLAPLEEKGMLRMATPPSLAWVRSSMGLMRFWSKAGLGCVALDLHDDGGDDGAGGSVLATTAAANGSVTMIAPLRGEEDDQAQAMIEDFGRKALRLMPAHYSTLPSDLALGLVNYYGGGSTCGGDGEDDGSRRRRPLTAEELGFLFSGHDLKRLEMYSKSLVDHQLVSDLLPVVGGLFFQGRVPGVDGLPWLHASILLGLGLQFKPVERLCAELQMPSHQILALFNKAVRRLTAAIRTIQEHSVEAEMSSSSSRQQQVGAAAAMTSLPVRLEEEMETSARESLANMKTQQEDLLRSLDVMKYAVKGSMEDWEEVLRDSKQVVSKGGTVQIRSAAKGGEVQAPMWERLGDDDDDEEGGRRRGKKRGAVSRKGGGKGQGVRRR